MGEKKEEMVVHEADEMAQREKIYLEGWSDDGKTTLPHLMVVVEREIWVGEKEAQVNGERMVWRNEIVGVWSTQKLEKYC